MKQFNYLIAFSAILFFLILPVLRLYSINTVPYILPLQVKEIYTPVESVAFLSLYGIIFILSWHLIGLTINSLNLKKLPRLGYSYSALNTTIVTLFTLLFMVLYKLSEIDNAIANVLFSGFALWIIANLDFSGFAKAFQIFKVLLAVTSTGRGLVATWIFSKAVQSSVLAKFLLALFLCAFMLLLDFLRNGVEFADLIKEIKWSNFAYLTYSFPFIDQFDGIYNFYRDSEKRSLIDVFSKLWFLIPREVCSCKPAIYGNEMYYTYEVFGLDPKIATLAITSAGVAFSYLGYYGLFLGPIIDVCVLLFSYFTIIWVFPPKKVEIRHFLMTYFLIKLFRNGTEFFFTSFPIMLLVCLFLNLLTQIHQFNRQ